MTVQTAEPMTTTTDRAWFAGQVEERLPELYGTALRLCRNEADAEDLVADAVAAAWEALPTLEERSSFRGWIFRILNNRFLSEVRSVRSRAPHEALDTTAEPHFSLFERLHQPILLWWGNPELEFLNHLLRDDLERAIASLPDVFRTAVVMVDVQGLSYREVAGLLEVPIGTVRSRLARGRGLLQGKLWEHAIEAGLAEGPPPDTRHEDEDEQRNP